MRVVVQRVKKANVTVSDKLVSEINQGYLLLVGFTLTDTLKEVQQVARKVANLRVFSDEDDKLNLNIKQIDGKILSISQFTVYGDLKKTNRPSFTKAKAYEEAKQLYEKFNDILRKEYQLEVQTGVFGENMQVSLVNDGPVTIIIDTDEL